MSAESTLVRAGMTPAVRCRYVADLIEAHPENFDMLWFATHAGSFNIERTLAAGDRPDVTDCGTTCCMAGWAVVVTPDAETIAAAGLDPRSATGFLAEAGRVLLGLSSRDEAVFYLPSLTPAEAAFLLRWHADELDRAS